MLNLKSIAGLAALAVLAACATATPYQAASVGDRGYTDQKIETNRFQVQFSGNSLTERKTVETYLLYRAAELTAQNGFDHFRVVTRDTEADSRVIPIGGTYSPFYDHFHCNYRFAGPYGALYRPSYPAFYPGRVHPAYRSAYNDPFWGGMTEYREITSYEATAEIQMGTGTKPDDPAYFDASQVLENLSGQIILPDPTA